MFDEVDQFLKRVRELQQQKQVAQSRPAPSPRQVPQVYDDLVDAEIIEAEPAEDVDMHVQRHVGAHVQQYLDRKKFEDRAEKLGDSVEIADDVMDAHIHEAFDHKLGALDKGTAALPGKVAADIRPDDLARNLRDPQSFRQAIIMAEILNRPMHRWK